MPPSTALAQRTAPEASWTVVYAALVLVWLLTSAGGGAVLAALARRGDPRLSFRRLWIFFAGLLALAAAAYFAIAIRAGL